MNILPKHLSLLIFIFISVCGFAQQHRIRLMEVHGEFLGNLKINDGGNSTNINQYGFGVNLNYGKEYLGIILEYDYRKIDLRNLNVPGVKSVSINEFYLGARYFPMRPTLLIGKMATRFTAGVEGGFDMQINWRILLFSGLAFSPIKSASGLSLNFVYRPGTFSAGGYPLKPCWMLRIGLILGPSFK